MYLAVAPHPASSQEKEFQRLYSLIPLEGQAAEFFVDTPKQILSGGGACMCLPLL